jgi:hypothetical protein
MKSLHKVLIDTFSLRSWLNSGGMILTWKMSLSLLAFFLFYPTFLPPHTSVKLENRKQKPSTVINHAIKVDYL